LGVVGGTSNPQNFTGVLGSNPISFYMSYLQPVSVTIPVGKNPSIPTTASAGLGGPGAGIMISANPEPSTWGFIVIGFALMFYMRRRLAAN
jgi:hypothetical protein